MSYIKDLIALLVALGDESIEHVQRSSQRKEKKNRFLVDVIITIRRQSVDILMASFQVVIARPTLTPSKSFTYKQIDSKVCLSGPNVLKHSSLTKFGLD